MQDEGATLRATSYYTGSTWWLDPWDGTEVAATRFLVDEVAEAAATDVKAENRRSGRRPQWDLRFTPPTA